VISVAPDAASSGEVATEMRQKRRLIQRSSRRPLRARTLLQTLFALLSKFCGHRRDFV